MSEIWAGAFLGIAVWNGINAALTGMLMPREMTVDNATFTVHLIFLILFGIVGVSLL